MILEEPPYTDACWAGDQGCAYTTAQILIVVRTELAEQQDLVDVLTKWDFSASNQLAVESYMNDSGEDFTTSADWFLKNTEAWKAWVTPEALAKNEAALAG